MTSEPVKQIMSNASPRSGLTVAEVQALRNSIERLREVAEAADQYHDVACDPDYCRLCKAIQAWKEARDD